MARATPIVCVSSAMMICTEEGVGSGSCTALISSTANVYIRVAVEEAGVLCAGGALARTTLLGSRYPENHVEQPRTGQNCLKQPRTGPNLSQLRIAGKNCLDRTTQNQEELHRTDENR